MNDSVILYRISAVNRGVLTFTKKLMFVHKVFDFPMRISPSRFCDSPPGVRVRVRSSPQLRTAGTDVVVRRCSQHWRGGQRGVDEKRRNPRKAISKVGGEFSNRPKISGFRPVFHIFGHFLDDFTFLRHPMTT